MRTLATLISLSLFAPLALAAPGDVRPAAPDPAPTRSALPATPTSTLAPIHLTETPERCHPIAKRASGSVLAQALTARISLASCIADARFSVLQLIDGQDSITTMDEAAAPSFVLLDEVAAAAADPVIEVMAIHAKAQLLHAMISRMEQTISSSVDATPEAHTLRVTRRAIMTELLTPWRDRTIEVYTAIDELAKSHPRLVANPVALAAIRDSREWLARPIAAR